MENKLKVGDRVRYKGSRNEGVVTKPSRPDGHGWWVAFDTGDWVGEELYGGDTFLELIEAAPEPLTPLEVARKAHNDLLEAGVLIHALQVWINQQEASEAAQKLQARRDAVAQTLTHKSGGDGTITYDSRITIVKRAIDRIIELEDELAAKESA